MGHGRLLLRKYERILLCKQEPVHSRIAQGLPRLHGSNAAGVCARISHGAHWGSGRELPREDLLTVEYPTYPTAQDPIVLGYESIMVGPGRLGPHGPLLQRSARIEGCP